MSRCTRTSRRVQRQTGAADDAGTASVRLLLAVSAYELRSWLKSREYRSLTFLDAHEVVAIAARGRDEARQLLEYARQCLGNAERALENVERWAATRRDTMIATRPIDDLEDVYLAAFSRRSSPGASVAGEILRGAGGISLELVIRPTSAGTVEVKVTGQSLFGSTTLEDMLSELVRELIGLGGGMAKEPGSNLPPLPQDMDGLMQYYERRKSEDRRYTLRQLAEEANYSHEYLKNRHAKWKKAQAASEGDRTTPAM